MEDFHDPKCEIARYKTQVAVFEGTHVFKTLPEEVQSQIFKEMVGEKVITSCRCAARKRNHSDLIRLWTAAGSARTYNKDTWKNIESQLFEIDEI